MTSIIWKDGAPFSTEHDDIYYPPQDGLGAARHVFLEPNRIAERFSHDSTVVVGELGFGTGLNFLACWQEWKRQSRSNRSRFTFISCEKAPLSAKALAEALKNFPELGEFSEQLLHSYQQYPPGFHSVSFEDGAITLLLLVGDIAETLPQLSAKVDAWFLDGFNPAKNPAMWSPEVLQLLADNSHVGTTLSTWCAAGVVRRSIADVGFEIEKFKGFGNKRHSVKGTFRAEVADSEETNSRSIPESALVIGAGIAGCMTAFYLAQAGTKVSLLDRGSLASGASGNRHAQIVPYFTKRPTQLSDLYVSGFYHVISFLKNNFPEGCGAWWHQVGAVQLPSSTRLRALYSSVRDEDNWPADFCQAIDAEQATEVCGVPLTKDALHYPLACVVDPAAFCRALVDKFPERIGLTENAEVTRLEHSGADWEVTILDKAETDSTLVAEHVVLASAWNTSKTADLEWLTTGKTRGQLVLKLAPTDVSVKLKTMLCYGGYLTPPLDGLHSIGATYSRDSYEGVVVDDTKAILEKAREHIPALQFTEDSVEESQTRFRATTYDKLPISGEIFHSLSEGEEAPIPRGLYSLVGLGSRGFTSASLLAHSHASFLITRVSLLPKDLEKRLSPGRVLKRHLKNLSLATKVT